MTVLQTVILVLNVIAVLTVPSRYALVPILFGCVYMAYGSCVDIGSFSFNAVRILITSGYLRIILRREMIKSRFLMLDKIMLIWAIWIIISSTLHPGTNPLVFNLGQAYNIAGMYFLMRILINNSDVDVIISAIAVLLVPIAIEMIHEQKTGKNYFALLGISCEQLELRNGGFRARGPFAHAILAGNVGATCLPMIVGIRSNFIVLSIFGTCACLIMVITSASSGPMISLCTSLFALYLWKHKYYARVLPYLACLIYILLEALMTRPAYYVISKIDLAGGSTGWHRARLIEMAIQHIDEWWLAGTNYTRHWMSSGVSWSPNHSDITNYYILMGVWGGLPLMFIYITMLVCGYTYVRKASNDLLQQADCKKYMAWCLGAALFSHTFATLSVAYFDQSYIFLILCLSCLSRIVTFKTD